MKRYFLFTNCISFFILSCCSIIGTCVAAEQSSQSIKLPSANLKGSVTLEQAIADRRSERYFSQSPLNLAEISQLLWAGQGVSNLSGFRTAPSAGALYPLEIFVIVGNVVNLSPGVYRYQPSDHSLAKIMTGDIRDDLCKASLHQPAVRKAPAVILISAVFQRTKQKYGQRGIRYVYIETGHAAQNICLETTAIGLKSVTIGAFDDEKTKKLLNLKTEEPLYLIPIGK